MESERHRQYLEALARRAMEEKGLRPEFPTAALKEAERLSPAGPGGHGVRDLRGLPWCSIDNDDTRDLDQLTVAEPLDGAARVRVAIADVDVLVEQGSAIDEHARTNTTSVYTVARVFHMLPERLSTGLTSLNEGEDRRTIVVELVVQRDGSTADEDVYPAVVRNRAKLTYAGVAAWLDGGGPLPQGMADIPELVEQIRLQDAAAQRLRRLRHECGALDLRRNDVQPVLRGNRVETLQNDDSDRAKELIQDFMITANSTMARFLESRRLPSLRRIVRQPRRWDRIVDLARLTGDRLPSEPDSGALSEFLARRREADPDAYPELSLAVVKLIGSGEYVADLPEDPAPGHFGLAVEDYTHATAPNRRYPDLVTHRILKAALAGRPTPYGSEELRELARHCTEQENNAQKVERQVRKSAAALLLEDRLGDTFRAVVTGASEKGTWVRIFHPAVEGRLERGFQGLDVGDCLTVRLIDLDVERGFIDFARERHG
jgi:VacB/RNase II family 3'-5' exoribonuclease